MTGSSGTTGSGRDRCPPTGERLDPGGGPLEEDPELSGIEESLDEGLIYIESIGGWIVREEADEEFGPEVAARMAAEQQVEFRDYLERRRAEARDE